MATAIFKLRNDTVVAFNNPSTSKEALRAAVEATRSGPGPTMTLISAGSPPVTLLKADIVGVEYH